MAIERQREGEQKTCFKPSNRVVSCSFPSNKSINYDSPGPPGADSTSLGVHFEPLPWMVCNMAHSVSSCFIFYVPVGCGPFQNVQPLSTWAFSGIPNRQTGKRKSIMNLLFKQSGDFPTCQRIQRPSLQPIWPMRFTGRGWGQSRRCQDERKISKDTQRESWGLHMKWVGPTRS